MTTELLRQRLDGAAAAIAALHDQVQTLHAICEAARTTIIGGGTIFTAGNGGSAAQALHLAEELIGRYRGDRPPFRAICLNADPTALTCIANDFGFDRVFARQVEALAGPDDALVVLSTSGRSPNLLAALEEARARGVRTLGLLGRDGGACLGSCDQALVVPGDDAAHIQEAHLVIVHLLCEGLE